jgi:hypothetical protein
MVRADARAHAHMSTYAHTCHQAVVSLPPHASASSYVSSCQRVWSRIRGRAAAPVRACHVQIGSSALTLSRMCRPPGHHARRQGEPQPRRAAAQRHRTAGGKAWGRRRRTGRTTHACFHPWTTPLPAAFPHQHTHSSTRSTRSTRSTLLNTINTHTSGHQTLLVLLPGCERAALALCHARLPRLSPPSPPLRPLSLPPPPRPWTSCSRGRTRSSATCFPRWTRPRRRGCWRPWLPTCARRCWRGCRRTWWRSSWR